MASCKDCINYDVCSTKGANCDRANHCEMFKDRTRFVELPYPKWINADDKLPEPEIEVLIITENNVVTTAMYEDGSIDREDSIWNWYDIDYNYNEESGQYLIPEGWWEYRHFNQEEVWNNSVDCKVTHWMPLPELPKGE